MRKMKNIKTGKTINVIEFIVLKKSCWEYYITDKVDEDGNGVEALIYGNEIEHAVVSLTGIKLEAGFRTKDLNQLQPVPGWIWMRGN